MNLSQKIVFSVWILLASLNIMLTFSVESYERESYILGLFLITAVFWVLFKVWADKKIKEGQK